MANVVQFPSGSPALTRASRASYSVHIRPTEAGFDWGIESDEEIYEDDMAADLASIALSIRPPKRTFFERLINLFTGD